MYPGSTFNIIDNSGIQNEQTNDVNVYRPLFMTVGSFDKGVEGFNRVYGRKFYDIYGSNMFFSKHGQNAIQAKKLIDAGAELLVYRVCANDSTLANLVLIANVTAAETQKVDEDGNPIYLDADGNETTQVTDNPVMIGSVKVKWETVSIAGCKTFKEVKEAVLDLANADAGVFPVMFFCDNGRGVSSKAVRLTPDYNTSRGIGKTFYSCAIYEGTSAEEAKTITVNPGVIYGNKSYGLVPNSLDQVDGEVIPEVYDAYIQTISNTLGIDVNTLASYDVVFGYTYKGAAIENFTVDAEGVDLNTEYGILLAEGDNGEFGDSPVGTEAWADAIRAVYAGEVTDEVYDVDTHQIAAVLDANLPIEVKEAISKLATFRKDFMFFRDLGTGHTTFSEIYDEFVKIKTKDRYTAPFLTSYNVKDPVTLRDIEVTMTYDMAAPLVNMFLTGTASAPTAGIVNGFVLTDAIKGTINFTPVVTPAVDQKQALDDLRLNYAIFQGDQCVVQTEYTSQEDWTELSYINNVINVQEVIRAIRTECPKNRFMLIDGYDMSEYAKKVRNVINNFTSAFYYIGFNYTQDKLRASQKIFYATLEVAFNQWEQAEIFDIYALNINSIID